MEYNFQQIEKKWQIFWARNQVFKAYNNSKKPKFYVLDMFPYPSGAGLHVGHPLGYIASDIIARFKRHKGFNVLHPQGYDSFGLPAEQFAIQTGQHPAKTTETNIKRYREQLDRMGFSFDWSREVRTSDSKYYRWTQWIFLKLFNAYYNTDKDMAFPISELISDFEREGNYKTNAHCDAETPLFHANQWNTFSEVEKEKILLKYRLTYLSETQVNWCPALGTVLANDEIINGVSERGGHPLTKKRMTQWSMRISPFANRLLEGLDLVDWPDSLKEIQRNWIGKSIGATIFFQIKGHKNKLEVFTTRPDTLFGVTYMTLAPEHELVKSITTSEQEKAVEDYIVQVSSKSDRERQADIKNISGIFTGAYAIHPFTKAEIPVWIGEYVLADYGTGAVMAVPSGDQRDFDFARYFNLPIINIYDGVDISKRAFVEKGNVKLTNSSFLNGLEYAEAIQKIISELEENNFGRGAINFRLRDAIFSRQRYWGEPIPIYFKSELPYPIAEKNLPLELPQVDKYLPTSDGKPPLGNAKNWAWDEVNEKVVGVDQINNKTIFPIELNTMPGWAGSSWYFNRYMDAINQEQFASKEAIDYWKEVDFYMGGSEHATGHLLYSRFWQKALFDLGYLKQDEFANKLVNQGMILGNSAFVYRKKGTQEFLSKGLVKKHEVEPIHVDVSLVNSSNELDINKVRSWQKDFEKVKFTLEDGKYIVGREVEKMSKSKHNVVNPDEICDTYGADTLRMYEMFLGPIEQDKPWNTAGISGVHNFLKKFWRLFYQNGKFKVDHEVASDESLKVLHQTIKKVTEDIERLSFNTCISSFMICVNKLTALNCSSHKILEPLLILLSPFAPHFSEELWSRLGHTKTIAFETFPKFDASKLEEKVKDYPVSFNGKIRFRLKLSLELSVDQIKEQVMNEERTISQLRGGSPKKIIVVQGKIINIVT
ncbi:MAG: leucine--tRNA ligase [Flavobacteriaceae bacterium TMED121]|nr:MAG: leucine--tRNA ligase [Flavobacteriaceae bacterium TMED121]